MNREEEISVVMKSIVDELSSKINSFNFDLSSEEKARLVVDKGRELQKYLNELDGAADWEYMSY